MLWLLEATCRQQVCECIVRSMHVAHLSRIMRWYMRECMEGPGYSCKPSRACRCCALSWLLVGAVADWQPACTWLISRPGHNSFFEIRGNMRRRWGAPPRRLLLTSNPAVDPGPRPAAGSLPAPPSFKVPAKRWCGAKSCRPVTPADPSAALRLMLAHATSV